MACFVSCKFSPVHARFVLRRRSHDVRVSACMRGAAVDFRRARRCHCVRMSPVGDMAVFSCIRIGLVG
eukprot:1650827-Pleurochrysis_carterae.AAC.1